MNGSLINLGKRKNCETNGRREKGERGTSDSTKRAKISKWGNFNSE